MFSFFLPVPFLFRTKTGRSRLIQMHWLPSNERREGEKGRDPPGSEGGLVSLLAKREREREGSRVLALARVGDGVGRRVAPKRREERSLYLLLLLPHLSPPPHR